MKLILDLEATCCDENEFPRSEMEIIEIGAAIYDEKTDRVIDTFQSFVYPVLRPKLTPFCTRLTGITQDDLRGASTYYYISAKFERWINEFDITGWGAWGDYDRHQIIMDNKRHGVDSYINFPYTNIKKLFSAHEKCKRRFGMDKALKRAGLTLHGDHHRALDDALNITQLYSYIHNNK